MSFITKIIGVLFIIAGLWGFSDTGFGMDSTVLLGVFPANIVSNLVHIGLGAWGYAASRSEETSGHYARWAGVVFLVLGGIGFASKSPFDLLPLGDGNRFLHLGVGFVLLLVGLIDAARPRQRNRTR